MKKQLLVFGVAREAWSLVTAHKKTLGMMLLAYIVLSMGSVFIDPQVGIVQSIPLGVAIACYVVTLILAMIVMWIIMINMYHMASGNPSLGWNVLRDYPRSRYWRLLGVVLVWILASILFVAVLGGAMTFFMANLAFVALGAPTSPMVWAMVAVSFTAYIAMFYLIMRYMFAAWIALFEGKKVFESFSLSAKLTKGVKWKMIGGYLVAIVVMMGVMFACVVPFLLISFLLESLPYVSFALLAVFSVIAVVVYLAMIGWWMMGMFVTYVTLKKQVPELAGGQTENQMVTEEEIIEVELVEEGNQTN